MEMSDLVSLSRGSGDWLQNQTIFGDGLQSIGHDVFEHFHKIKAWGLLSCIDLHDCDPEIIRNADKIRDFVIRLCELIEMKRFGDTQIVHFGEDERVAGYSMTQLIETSLISAHFANQTNATYLDVFSCKPYEPKVVADFAKDFFKASEVNLQVNFRR
jgi:S-adenosylmethionine/arginine decarboxylase-like enzyme